MGLNVGNVIQSPRSVLRHLGSRFRARRLAARLSQEALAKRAGLSRDTVVRLEGGHSIGLEQLLSLAVALDATAEFEGLFPPAEARSLDEILATQRKPQRVRMSPNTSERSKRTS